MDERLAQYCLNIFISRCHFVRKVTEMVSYVVGSAIGGV